MSYKIILFGSSGFVGRNLERKILNDYPEWEVHSPSRHEVDLTGDFSEYVYNLRPDLVIHLGAFCGGIGLNDRYPADMIWVNLQMGLNVIEACRRARCKLLFLGSVCSYPHTPRNIPFVEDDLWYGRPERTNEPYGVAKKTIGLALDAFYRQYSLESIYLIPTNMYGPYDHFDLSGSHVIPAMIRKFHDAVVSGEKTVCLWGDGSPSRDFLFVDDCCEAIIRAIKFGIIEPTPINIGSGVETTMFELAGLISDIVGFDGDIIWDSLRPNGQPRRVLDTSKCDNVLNFRPETSLRDGLAETYDWFCEGR